MTRPRVLVGFAESLSAIEVTHSLHRAGFEIFLFARENALTALSSGELGQRLERVVAPEDDVSASLVELEDLWLKLERPAVFPLDDASLWMVRELAERAPETVVVGARGDHVDVALDKARQIEIAVEAGFDVLPTSPAGSNVDFEFPQFVKGTLGAENRDGRLQRTGGRRVETAQELREFIAGARNSPLISQPCVKGVGEGVFGLAQGGQLVLSSGHRRLRMMNPSGSGSSACEPRTPSQDELERTRQFLKISGWSGLFMLEFLRDDAGTSWFMELNGRPWGSMSLARSQGFDYSRLAVELTCDGEVPEVSPALTTPTEFECRHLGRELIHLAFLLFRRRTSDERWPKLRSSLAKMIFPGHPVRFYNLGVAGWRVFLCDTLFSLAHHDSRSKLGKAMTAPKRLVGRILRLRVDATSKDAQRRLQEKLARATRIAVVCYGNINRSPVMEALCQECFPTTWKSAPTVYTGVAVGAADSTMVRVALDMGLDIGRHRSRTFTSADVKKNDLILAMESWHVVKLEDRYPELRGRVFPAGLLDDWPTKIRDPFRKELQVYSTVAQRIVRLADVIGRHVEAARVARAQGSEPK